MSFICQCRAIFSIPYIGNVLYRVLLNIFWSQMSFICQRRAFFSIPYIGYVPYRFIYMVHGSTGTISFVYKGVADGDIYSSLLQPASPIGYWLRLLVQKYPMSLTGITTGGFWDCTSHNICSDTYLHEVPQVTSGILLDYITKTGLQSIFADCLDWAIKPGVLCCN